MTRPLRRLHLRLWIVLAVALPALVWVGLASRRPTAPRNPDLLWERFR